jgi:hypothetical protein
LPVTSICSTRACVRVTSELHESLALQCEKIGFADDIDQILLAARQHIGERTRDHPVIGRSETAGLEAFDGEFERHLPPAPGRRNSGGAGGAYPSTSARAFNFASLKTIAVHRDAVAGSQEAIFFCFGRGFATIAVETVSKTLRRRHGPFGQSGICRQRSSISPQPPQPGIRPTPHSTRPI